MRSLFNLINGEITNMTYYNFPDGSYLKLEINDVDDKEINTPFGYLIKVEEFTKNNKRVYHPYINGYEKCETGEIYYMRLRDIEEEYDIFFNIIESIIYT